MGDTSDSLLTFGKAVIDACQGEIGIIKPQVAFFERHGSKGFAVLEELSEYAASAKLLVIIDAKRGDIGTTMDGYFDAWLGKAAPFFADALTVSPYLGFDSLLPTLSEAHERGKGVFILAATSNKEAKELQSSTFKGNTVAGTIWNKLNAANRAIDGERMGSFGAVIGATVNPESIGISFDSAATTPILAPGFGAQGAMLNQFSQLFESATSRTIATVSRSILSGGALLIDNNISKAKQELESGSATGTFDE